MPEPYHHGALRAAMLDTALAEVRARGAEQVSLRGIATELGVSPSAAYNHFADKDALLRSVGEVGFAELDRRMAEAVAEHPGTGDRAALDRFRALGRAYLDFALADPHLFRLTFGPLCFAHHDPGGDDEGPYRRLCAALDELDARGMLRTGIRPGLDVTVWASVHGLAELLLVGGATSEAVSPFLDSIAGLVLASTSP